RAAFVTQCDPIAPLWQLDALLIRHLQEEQERDLLDVVAVVDAIVAQGVAEPPEFLNDVTHAAMASLKALSRVGSLPLNTRLALPQPPAFCNTGTFSKSSSSIERFATRCSRMRMSHRCCSCVNV